MEKHNFIPHRQKHRVDSAIDAACPGKFAVFSIASGKQLSESKPLSQALDDQILMGDGNGLEVRRA